MTFRKVLSIVIGATAALSAGMALIIFSSAGVIDDTIAHSHWIDAAFREATAFVGEWRRSTGRLPTSDEYAAWASKQSDEAYTAKVVQYSLDNFPQEVITKFGSATGEAYLLTFWRGEWNEYYASWTDTSSLIFEPEKYFVLGSPWLDLIAFGFVGLVLAGVAFVIWPPNKPLQRRWPPPSAADRWR